ncbi:hypothetical protein U1Q18_050465 [Sarracenia purpurea var. burkii]
MSSRDQRIVSKVFANKREYSRHKAIRIPPPVPLKPSVLKLKSPSPKDPPRNLGVGFHRPNVRYRLVAGSSRWLNGFKMSIKGFHTTFR